MKKYKLITSVLLITKYCFLSIAAAGTVNQGTAKEMTAILESQEVNNYLSQEDGPGNLIGINYHSSGRASFGPSNYDLNFRSNSGPVSQNCKLRVRINIETLKVLSGSKFSCVEIK